MQQGGIPRIPLLRVCSRDLSAMSQQLEIECGYIYMMFKSLPMLQLYRYSTIMLACGIQQPPTFRLHGRSIHLPTSQLAPCIFPPHLFGEFSNFHGYTDSVNISSKSRLISSFFLLLNMTLYRSDIALLVSSSTNAGPLSSMHFQSYFSSK